MVTTKSKHKCQTITKFCYKIENRKFVAKTIKIHQTCFTIFSISPTFATDGHIPITTISNILSSMVTVSKVGKMFGAFGINLAIETRKRFAGLLQFKDFFRIFSCLHIGYLISLSSLPEYTRANGLWMGMR